MMQYLIIQNNNKYIVKNQELPHLIKVEKLYTITLKAYRNDQSYMQDLPSIQLLEGQTFHLTNQNAPSIEGYDFVCCTYNNTIVNNNIEIKVYYIPQSIPDRNSKSWNARYTTSSGDLYMTDFVNTYVGEDFAFMFGTTSTIMSAPKINTSNGITASYMF